MKTFWADFKKFITKGNVLDLAVATIIGASFTTISTTFTQGIIMPLVNLLFKVDLSTEYLVLKEAVYDPVDPTVVVEAAVLWRYGDLIQAIINFLIIALFLFILVKVIAKVKSTLDFNANMCELVQKKLDTDEELNKFEAKWLKRYTKSNPDTAPKKVVVEPVVEEAPAEPVVPELTTTEKLLTEILQELKAKNAEEEVKAE